MKEIPWNLIISKLSNKLTQEEEVQFDEWLKTDKNEFLFQECKTVWENVRKKVSGYEPDVELCWEELSKRIHKNTLPQKTIDTHFTKRHKFSRIARYAAAIAVLLATTFGLAYYIGKGNSDSVKDCIAYSTVNSKSKVTLPDSSLVWLHNHTSVIYCYNEKENQREITIEGEAFFDVKHDKANPFIVTANDIQVKVHGTQFNVKSLPDSENVLVSLYEGSVSMDFQGKEYILKPGEEGIYNINSKEINIQKGDVEFAKIWTTDKIRFQKKNLREVCKYLSKWYAVEFDIDPGIGDNQLYTFTFRGQSLKEVVELMTTIHSFTYHIDKTRNIVLIKK